MALPVLFGANVDPTWKDPGQPLRTAELAESLGYDLVTVQDHPYQPAFYETWTLITHLAAKTSRVTLVPTVACLPLRPPAMLAKSAATLDLLSGGRLQLGLGAGAFWDAIAAMDGPRRTPKEAVDALGEAVDVIRAMWSGGRSVRYDGEHYRLRGTHPSPQPGNGLGLWLGAYGKRMLDLTGAKADGWMPSAAYLPVERLSDAVGRIRASAERADRDPDALRLVYNISGTIGAESTTPFHGSSAQWVDQLVRLNQDLGMNAFVYWPAADHKEQLAEFAHTVLPAVRSALN